MVRKNKVGDRTSERVLEGNGSKLQTVYRFTEGKSNSSLYYYSQGKESVEMIESYSGKTKKAILNIDRMKPKNPEAITIEHPGMGLKIEMTRLKTPTDDSVE